MRRRSEGVGLRTELTNSDAHSNTWAAETTPWGHHGDVIGLLGGMGPAATADFYHKLVASTCAGKDQDHPRVVIWADPTVPDRSQAILGLGPDPIPWLLHGIRTLNAAGATMIAIPCNTAHAFLPRLQDATSVPIISMIDTATVLVRHQFPAAVRVGVLATTGTLQSHLYQGALSTMGIEVIAPTATQQNGVMLAIGKIKAGDRSAKPTEALMGAADWLVGEGAQLIIAGCTEVVLGMHLERLKVPLVDPAQALVDVLLARYSAGTSRC